MDEQSTGFTEKRTSPRIDMDKEQIQLHWLDHHGESHSAEAICIDLALHGILFDYCAPFTLGEQLTVIFNPQTPAEKAVKGQVCRCAKRHDNSYHVAMQLL